MITQILVEKESFKFGYRGWCKATQWARKRTILIERDDNVNEDDEDEIFMRVDESYVAGQLKVCCMIFFNSSVLSSLISCMWMIVSERPALSISHPFLTLAKLKPFEQYHVVMNGIPRTFSVHLIFQGPCVFFLN